ncbi:MAG: DUF3467 domain-containing protein [Anaerolineales bacterium]
MADPKPASKGEEAGKPAPVRPRLVFPSGQEAVYSNVVRIAHSPSEMVFDFGRLLPGEIEIMIKARIMMSPLSAKLLQRALADNLAKYEAMFGEIKIPRGKSLADDLFRSLQHPEPPKPEGNP